MTEAFYWIGVGATAAIATLLVLAALIWLYAVLLHGRFNLIFFRKGDRRLSIASWHNSQMFNQDAYWADDFPIGPRPFYLSYRVGGERRAFIMLGMIDACRHAPIHGKHPEHN
ncbi:hypothetical protein SAMN03159338_1546 [Sphingomonas sp. NFR04]|uniref:hypothetical protein n=1 Tax=Sphingomonas sp. NFR04 TaxID=1566283 RepID=UPI0008E98E41|nr:hypothetical protein [Sphingomonas sp. NFR04]SFJ49108.1 hypothetical protein SAMN03159338_1546 [Sphingomonas sp. NFR04]